MSSPRVGILLIVVLTLAAGGCGDSYEAINRDAVEAQKEFCTILASVKDEATAQEAATQLDALAIKMRRIEKRSRAMGKPPVEVKNAMQRKYKPELEKTAETARETLERIDPGLRSHLETSLGRIAAANAF
jgi:hypothetical protein